MELLSLAHYKLLAAAASLRGNTEGRGEGGRGKEEGGRGEGRGREGGAEEEKKGRTPKKRKRGRKDGWREGAGRSEDILCTY